VPTPDRVALALPITGTVGTRDRHPVDRDARRPQAMYERVCDFHSAAVTVALGGDLGAVSLLFSDGLR
jgi:hypothetical protein